MVETEKYGEFTIYKSDISSSFVYANFDNPDVFINGLSDYLVNENSLLNYANMHTPIKFEPSHRAYKKIYQTLELFLNSQLDNLAVEENGKIVTSSGQEFKCTDSRGKTLIQNDKIGKIGEYAFHLIMTGHYKINCIIPKFTLITDRNMSVNGIDALFYDPKENLLYFGESKVSENITGAINLANKSLKDYEEQISEEYKLVLSDSEKYQLSREFTEAFDQYSNLCISFKGFIEKASIKKICIPVFMAHGNSEKHFTPEEFLNQMNTKISRNQLFGLETEYIFISLPLIDKAKMIETFMRKVLEKKNEYERIFKSI